MTDHGTRRIVEGILIDRDMHFSRRVIDGLVATSHRSVTPIFCMASYLSLFLFESLQYYTRVDPARVVGLEASSSSIIGRSRTSLKLFDDNKRELEGVVQYFEEGFIPEHRSTFTGNTWLPAARVLETDVAVMSYRGRPVCTSHGAFFNMGLLPDSIGDLEALKPVLLGIGEGYGRYFDTMARGPWQGRSYIDDVSFRSFKDRDVKSEKFYAARFDSSFSVGLTAALTVFQCSLNFLDLLVSLDKSEGSRDTTFKIEFITLYHVVSSLHALRRTPSVDANASSKAHLDSILDSKEAQLLMGSEAEMLRNTLVHYGLDSRIDITRLSPDKNLCGLVEACFPGHGFVNLHEAIDTEIRRIAELLDTWSS
jgi:hypothetical protein